MCKQPPRALPRSVPAVAPPYQLPHWVRGYTGAAPQGPASPWCHPAPRPKQPGGSGRGAGTRSLLRLTQPQECGFWPCPTARCGGKLSENGFLFLLFLTGQVKVSVPP